MRTCPGRLLIPVVALLSFAVPAPATSPPAAAIVPAAARGLPRGTRLAFPHLLFQLPVFAVEIPVGPPRLLVFEQRGRVFLIPKRRSARPRDKRLVLDLEHKLKPNDYIGGVLGFAFHPRFARNRQVFIYYVGPRAVLARFAMDPRTGAIDPASERVLLTIENPDDKHHGGSVDFGPDGYLYLAVGDMGPQHDPDNVAQDLGSLRGKILRLDVDGGDPYRIPDDNPFVATPDARPEIFALGLRNPWRFAFDPFTGDLWTGDVGQNAIEEVNIVRRGGNYGWNFYEGTLAHARHDGKTAPAGAFVPPVFEYPRAEGVSVTGGYVYRGRRFPALRGAYVLADWGSGNVWALHRARRDRAGGVMTAEPALALPSIDARLLLRAPQIGSFGELRDGELLLIALTGHILELSPRPSESRAAGTKKRPPEDEAALLALARNPFVRERGAATYAVACQPCHGAAGEGAQGPNLRDDRWLKGGALVDVWNSIAEGSPYKGMPVWGEVYGTNDLDALTAFVAYLPCRPGGVAKKAPEGEVRPRALTCEDPNVPPRATR